MATYRDAFPILEVADVERSLAFYGDLLGFRMGFSFDDDDGRPVFAALQLEGGGKLAVAGPSEGVESGSTAVWLYTDNVDGAVAELSRAGVEVRAQPADREWGERVASVADPDGYTIHLGSTSQ